MDNRGNPVILAAPTINPPPLNVVLTDKTGRYEAYLLAQGNHALSIDVPGYTQLAPQSMEMDRDRARQDYLVPVDNLLQNGEFEDSATQLSGWTLGGSLPIELTDAAHTDLRAAVLGARCTPYPCLGSPIFEGRGERGALVRDDSGTLHALFISEHPYSPFTPGLFYSNTDPTLRFQIGGRCLVSTRRSGFRITSRFCDRPGRHTASG